MRIRLRVKYPLFLPDFNETWIFLTDFRIILKYQLVMEILSVVAEWFQAGGLTDGQADMTSQQLPFAILQRSLKTIAY